MQFQFDDSCVQSEDQSSVQFNVEQSTLAHIRHKSPSITQTLETPTGVDEFINDGLLRILVVEDNIINQKVVSKLLDKNGHHTTIASNGQEALEILELSDFDLILMDVQMPVMDGLEATQIIRKRESETIEHRTIVAMTANAMIGDREICLDAGMDDYIAKPIRADELDVIVRRVQDKTLLSSPSPM